MKKKSKGKYSLESLNKIKAKYKIEDLKYFVENIIEEKEPPTLRFFILVLTALTSRNHLKLATIKKILTSLNVKWCNKRIYFTLRDLRLRGLIRVIKESFRGRGEYSVCIEERILDYVREVILERLEPEFTALLTYYLNVMGVKLWDGVKRIHNMYKDLVKKALNKVKEKQLEELKKIDIKEVEKIKEEFSIS